MELMRTVCKHWHYPAHRESKKFPSLKRVSCLYQLWVENLDDPRAGADPRCAPAPDSVSWHDLTEPSLCLAGGGTGWIYVICGKHDSKAKYVGFTLLGRMYGHYSEHKADDADAKQMQQDMKYYGIENFVIFGLERVTATKTRDLPSGLISMHRRREQFWISRLNTLNEGYNERREVAAFAHGPNPPRETPQQRQALYLQREYPLKAQHLLTHWVNSEESLPSNLR